MGFINARGTLYFEEKGDGVPILLIHRRARPLRRGLLRRGSRPGRTGW